MVYSSSEGVLFPLNQTLIKIFKALFYEYIVHIFLLSRRKSENQMNQNVHNGEFEEKKI